MHVKCLISTRPVHESSVQNMAGQIKMCLKCVFLPEINRFFLKKVKKWYALPKNLMKNKQT